MFGILPAAERAGCKDVPKAAVGGANEQTRFVGRLAGLE
jgi:hypothetical protein